MAHQPHLLLASPWTKPSLELTPMKAHHLFKVLRFNNGANVTYTDGTGRKGRGQLQGQTVIRGPEEHIPPPPVELNLAVAPPREKDRARFLVEKAAELEVSSLTWLRTRFGQGSAPSPVRVRAWAVSALEQSQGAYLLSVAEQPVETSALADGEIWFTDPAGESLTGSVPRRLTVAIGPEGGWSEGEIPVGVRRVSLGRTILRVETAVVVVAGLIVRF